jgi:hypothetical protein
VRDFSGFRLAVIIVADGVDGDVRKGYVFLSVSHVVLFEGVHEGARGNRCTAITS